MPLSKTGDAAVAEVITRAISIRPKLRLADVRGAIDQSHIGNGPAHARLLLSLFDEWCEPGFVAECVSAIASQSTWPLLCGELVRYSNTKREIIEVFLGVLAQCQPKHAIAKACKGRRVVASVPAFGVIDSGQHVSFDYSGVDDDLQGAQAFFISIDDPVNGYSEASFLHRAGPAAHFEVDRSSVLFEDRTIVMRPAVFFAVR